MNAPAKAREKKGAARRGFWWEVSHPDFESAALVFAQDIPGALAAAAVGWGRRWQDFDFYAFAHVRQMTGGSAVYP